MNKNFKILYLILIGLGLLSGESKGMQRGWQQLPVYGGGAGTFAGTQYTPQQTGLYPSAPEVFYSGSSGAAGTQFIPAQPSVIQTPEGESTYQYYSTVPTGTLEAMFRDIDELWDLYIKAPRNANFQFSNPENWERMVVLARSIQGWAAGSSNKELRQAAQQLLDLFTKNNPKVFVATTVASHLNTIITVANGIIKANAEIYQRNPRYAVQSHSLISEKQLLGSGPNVPSIYSAQQAASGVVSDWTKWATKPIRPIVQSGWDYAKWAAEKIGGGLGQARQWMLPSEVELATAKTELPLVNNDIAILEALPNPTEADRVLLKTLKAKKYYFESILGWTPTMLKAAAVGAGLLAIQSGVPSEVLRGAGSLTTTGLRTGGAITKEAVRATGTAAKEVGKLGIGAAAETVNLGKGAVKEGWQLTKEAAAGTYGLVKGE